MNIFFTFVKAKFTFWGWKLDGKISKYDQGNLFYESRTYLADEQRRHTYYA